MNPEIPSQRIPFALITVAIAAVLYSVQFFTPHNKVWMCGGYQGKRLDIAPSLNYKAITMVAVVPSSRIVGYEFTLAGAEPVFEMNRSLRSSVRDPKVLPEEGELWSDYALRNGAASRFAVDDRVRLIPCTPQ